MAKNTTAKNANTSNKKASHHAKAGRLGGKAPHICRGSECTKLKKAAANLKKARGYSAEDLLAFFDIAMPKHSNAKTSAKAKKNTAQKKTTNQRGRRMKKAAGTKKAAIKHV